MYKCFKNKKHVFEIQVLKFKNKVKKKSLPCGPLVGGTSETKSL